MVVKLKSKGKPTKKKVEDEDPRKKQTWYLESRKKANGVELEKLKEVGLRDGQRDKRSEPGMCRFLGGKRVLN